MGVFFCIYGLFIPCEEHEWLCNLDFGVVCSLLKLFSERITQKMNFCLVYFISLCELFFKEGVEELKQQFVTQKVTNSQNYYWNWLLLTESIHYHEPRCGALANTLVNHDQHWMSVRVDVIHNWPRNSMRFINVTSWISWRFGVGWRDGFCDDWCYMQTRFIVILTAEAFLNFI